MAEHFMELLCPAGNMDKLKMAIRYGADAVYCAGKRFGLRAGNSNFSDEELKEAVEFVHAHGKKIHVTCNIIPHNEDFEGLEDYLKFLESIGIDAIIVADMGIFSLAKRVAPGLELHVSTQASTTNWHTVQMWKELGATRVVAAREVSLADLKEMK
ncbi:MAG: peptidase U32 family protein, partial [Veillonella parvula]